jgi:outer membrane protein
MPFERNRPSTLRPAAPRSPWRLWLLAAALSLGAGASRAQSLQELYEAARGFDATYLAARALLDSAQYKAEQVNALQRPSVGLTVGAARSTSDTPYTSPLNSTANSVNAGLTGSQQLFNRANDATVQQAAKALEVSRADFETAEQDLILRVAQAYFDVLAAQDALATTRTSKASISEQLASAKRNFEVGTATITDTREAQARFDLGTAQEIAADNDLRAKRIALDQLVGRSNVTPRGLAAPVTLPPVMPAVVEEWVTQADAEHPTVRRARLALEVAKLETQKAQAGNLPTVALNGSLGKGHVSANGDSRSATTGQVVGFNQSGTNTSTSLGVTLNLPLFAGYAIQNRIKETLSLEEKSRNDLEAARRGVAQSTRVAFFGVQSGLAQVKALEAAESSSQLALEATQLGYRVGVRVNLDVLNSQTQLFTTQRDLAKARYDVLVNGLKLRQASGQLKPNDIGAVNQLLAK